MDLLESKLIVTLGPEVRHCMKLSLSNYYSTGPKLCPTILSYRYELILNVDMQSTEVNFSIIITSFKFDNVN